MSGDDEHSSVAPRYAAHLLGLTAEKLTRHDSSSPSQFGHLLETFVAGELIRQASWQQEITACGHWRTSDGDEIDLVLERDDGGVLAFEVKAADQVAGRDMGDLGKLRRRPRGTLPCRRGPVHRYAGVQLRRPLARHADRPALESAMRSQTEQAWSRERNLCLRTPPPKSPGSHQNKSEVMAAPTAGID